MFSRGVACVLCICACDGHTQRASVSCCSCPAFRMSQGCLCSGTYPSFLYNNIDDERKMRDRKKVKLGAGIRFWSNPLLFTPSHPSLPSSLPPPIEPPPK